MYDLNKFKEDWHPDHYDVVMVEDKHTSCTECAFQKLTLSSLSQSTLGRWSLSVDICRGFLSPWFPLWTTNPHWIVIYEIYNPPLQDGDRLPHRHRAMVEGVEICSRISTLAVRPAARVIGTSPLPPQQALKKQRSAFNSHAFQPHSTPIFQKD